MSGLNRSFTIPGANNTTLILHPNTIQFDAAAPGGTSGSPLLDCRGRVLGVQAAGYYLEDLNYAIAASVVREVVPSLVENGTYRHSRLGVNLSDMRTMTPTLARVNGLDFTRGVLVGDVFPDSPADGKLRETRPPTVEPVSPSAAT